MISSWPEPRAPILTTERLRLRPHRAEDYETCCSIWGDPDVTRFIGGRPQTREEVWARLLRYVGMWSLIGTGFWAIEDRQSGLYIGDVGVMNARREMTPPLGDDPEVGWTLAPSSQGRGFASEAVGAAIAWADANLGQPTLVCMIDPGNAPSLRLAEKFGFRERARAIYHGEPTIQFERPSRRQA